MLLTAKDYQNIARQMNIAERSIQRILGSVIVEVNSSLEMDQISQLTELPTPNHPSQQSDTNTTRRFDIGLRFGRDSGTDGINNVSGVVGVLKEYRSSCPIIFEWMQRGDFDPKKIPDSATRGLIMHASRTAGRLRAKVLRT